MISIREATRNDANSIANIQVKAWQSAYKEIMPENYLNSLSIDSKTRQWDGSLAKDSPGITLCIEINQTIVGFSVYGPARDRDLFSTNSGELVALNILPSHWGKGLGSEAVRFIITASKQKSWDALYLWVAKKNQRARNLYEHLGFLKEGSEKIDTSLTGHKLHELRYENKLKR